VKLAQVISDLLAEQAALDDIVVALDDDQWSADTASPRWNVTDQIAHLTYFDNRAAHAINDPDGFQLEAKRLISVSAEGIEAGDELTLHAVRDRPIEERLDAWRGGRATLAEAAQTLSDGSRVEWYGPSMGAKSFLTARLMEVWAHGQDIVDAVGASRPATDRLRHVAQLGYITRGWTYINRREEVPEGEVRLVLNAPSGATWTWGPEDSAHTASGAAEDFCLVVTQRRNIDETDLVVDGDLAIDWLNKAQAFAGPPTDGPVRSSS
jgi:uncharacterized protein (TIGR03084 family)